MATQFTPCSACGAVGEVGEKCQFCGTTIELKEGVIPSNARVVRYRTVTPQQYADKISIYHKVETEDNTVIKVSIGDQYGLVNLNGDLIYPLGSKEILSVLGNIIVFGYEYEDTIFGTTYSYTRTIKTGYYNLENGQHADRYGFIEDKDNPKRRYRVNAENHWEPINTYVNLKGENCTFDYAEYTDDMYHCAYIFHKGNRCSLYMPDCDLSEHGYPKEQECIIEGCGEIIKSSSELSLPILNKNGISTNLVYAKLNNRNRWERNREESIFKDWLEKSGVITPKEEKEREKEREREEIDRKATLGEFYAGLAIVILCLPFTIWFLCIALNDGDFLFYFGVALTAGCIIYGIVHMLQNIPKRIK